MQGSSSPSPPEPHQHPLKECDWQVTALVLISVDLTAGRGFLEEALGAALRALTWEKLPLLTPFRGLASLCRWPCRVLCKPCQKFTFSALESHLGLDQNQSFSFLRGTPCSLPLALSELTVSKILSCPGRPRICPS